MTVYNRKISIVSTNLYQIYITARAYKNRWLLVSLSCTVFNTFKMKIQSLVLYIYIDL